MEERKCSVCENEVKKEYNFCPYCGEPMNELAKEIQKRQATIAQLKLLGALIEKVQDKNTLELLQKLASQYKKDLWLFEIWNKIRYNCKGDLAIFLSK